MTGKTELYKNTKGAKENFSFTEATPKAELKDTVELMLSKNYKDRFDAEVMQLEIRIEKLRDMLDRYRAGTLKFKPSCPIELLECQLLSMKMYLELLNDRKAFESAAKKEKSTEQESVMLITRNEASSLLCELANSNIIADDIYDKLMEIVTIIDDEQLGYHFWGADADERAKLFTAGRTDLITDEHRERCADIANKYSFVPSDYERKEVQENIDAVADFWDDEEEEVE